MAPLGINRTFTATRHQKDNYSKVSKGAKIRNRYNQVPHLTQDTNGKVTNSQQTPQTKAKRSALSQQVTTKHIKTDTHKDIANTRQNKNIKEVPPWNGGKPLSLPCQDYCKTSKENCNAYQNKYQTQKSTNNVWYIKQ